MFMDNNNGNPAQGGEPAMEAEDWRSQLQPASRQRIVDKITETLKRHLPFSSQEGLVEIQKIAVRFEEKIYAAATSQSDYLRKISWKMLTMEEPKSQNTMANSLQSNAAGPSVMQPQVTNQGQLSSENIESNIPLAGVQFSAGLSSAQAPTPALNMSALLFALPPTTGTDVPTSISSALPSSQGINMSISSSELFPAYGVNQSESSSAILYPSRFMDNNNGNPAQGGEPATEAGDWRSQLQAALRQRIVNKITEILKRHLPFSGQEGLAEIQKIAVRFEEKIYAAATSQPDYLQKISLKMLNMEAKSQKTMTNSLQSNSAGSSVTQPQVMNEGQLSSENIESNIPPAGVQFSAGLSSAHAPTPALNMSALLAALPPSPGTDVPASISSPLSSPQGISMSSSSSELFPAYGVNQSKSSSSLPPAWSLNVLADHQRRQVVPEQQQQQQQSDNPQQWLYHQQLQQLLQGQPQLQQVLSQKTPLASPQQSHVQSASLVVQSFLHPNQQSAIPHLTESILQQTAMPQLQMLPPQHQEQQLTASLDSTAQIGDNNGAEWQEEVYKKIKVMKEMYYPELSEMYQKIAGKLHQHDSLPQQPKSDQLGKLKMFKAMLERLITILQLPKSDISPGVKEKLSAYEKQIVNFINTNRPRKPVPSLQPGQLPPPHMQSVQQSQSQITQLQSHENQMNPQLQSMNLQGSVPTMQQNNMTGLQQNSMSSLSGVSTAQQNMMNPLQPSSNMDPGQGTSLNSVQQQVPVGSIQQTPVSAPQQANMNALSSQNGINVLQNNINPLQSNPGILHSQHLKQQEQQLYQNQLKQQYQQRQMQQQLMQKQQIIQQQQQQQLQQQAKQQLPGQLQAHQMPQLHQISDVNDVKIRPMGVKPGTFQQHMSVSQRAYPHSQLKSASPYPASSNQLLQAQSPQLSQHSSPQVDQQLLVPKAGTPLQNASSPFVIPSPSTPIAPSPMPGDSEKPSSLSNAGNVGHQPTAGVGAQVQSLAIGTPGISASPLLAEFTGPDGTHANALSTISGKSSVTEQPLERLIKAVKSISQKALSASVSDIGSVVSMIDRIAGSAPGNGSRAAVGEDLVAMTKCRLQARNYITHDGTTNGTRKMRRYTSAMPLNVVSSGGSMNDSFKQLTGSETSDLESTATSRIKRPRIEANHALMEEIREINRRLIDTVVDISDEDVDPSAAAAERGEGIIVKCSFDAVALSPNLKSQYASAQMSPIQPLRLLVPTNYPNCSPILLDKFPVEVSKEYEDLSVKAKSRFSISLRSISQPMSLGEIARTWDICARAVISEHAQRSGGGSFSSKYGSWENCLSAA